MQLAATRPGTERDEVATPVTIRLVVVEARGAVQGLVDIADQVDEPDEIVRFQGCWSARRCQGGSKLGNLRFHIRGARLFKPGAIWREGNVDVVPVAVLKTVGVSNVVCRDRRGRILTVVRVAGPALLDGVRPGRGDHEGDDVAILGRGVRDPVGVHRVEFEKIHHFSLHGGRQSLVGDSCHRHVAEAVPAHG